MFFAQHMQVLALSLLGVVLLHISTEVRPAGERAAAKRRVSSLLSHWPRNDRIGTPQAGVDTPQRVHSPRNFLISQDESRSAEGVSLGRDTLPAAAITQAESARDHVWG